MTMKIFSFNFIVTYTPTFIVAYWDRNSNLLASSLMTVMIGK